MLKRGFISDFNANQRLKRLLSADGSQFQQRLDYHGNAEATLKNNVELRPVVGLTRGLTLAELKSLTVNAIRLHRQLVEKADQLYHALPEDYQTGKSVGGEQHLEYVEAMIEMHSQMIAVNTLVGLLDYIPRVSVN